MKDRSNALGRSDHMLTIQSDEEINLLEEHFEKGSCMCESACITWLVVQRTRRKLGSLYNGNYLMSLELIAEFDPFLAKHIARYRNPGSGHTSYLSSTMCEEFIRLMGEKILKKILMDIFL
ncbi:hypothetical protein QE152_g19065 [Popillia japonica]|uniref:Uncharacterized protein n=1 Tax=Popillia japonica TaxID=7064 RepID=A0AAW1L4J3_POPJA